MLLSLPALDDGGIDFDTALAACCLVAGNRWRDGFFSSDRGGASSVARPHDGILREPHYFFHLSGPLDPPYPVVPRFSHWRFPHGDLPPPWQRWAADAAAASPPGAAQRCVLSNYGDGLEIAHLLPAGEDDWWLSNQMQQYSPTQLFSSDPINGPANLITLRADLHRVFDERHFCHVPKVGSVGDGEEADTGNGAATVAGRPQPPPPQLVLHVFTSTPSGQLPTLWHNRAVHPIPATVAVQCLFTRFAWTVLSPRVFDLFLPSTPVPRRLLLWSREKGEWETETASPEMCRTMWKNARSRSPRKRSAPTSVDDAAAAAEEQLLLAEECLGLLDSGYSGTDENDGNDGLGPAPRRSEKPRGRLRKRKLSLEEDEGDDCKNVGQSCRPRRKMLVSILS